MGLWPYKKKKKINDFQKRQVKSLPEICSAAASWLPGHDNLFREGFPEKLFEHQKCLADLSWWLKWMNQVNIADATKNLNISQNQAQRAWKYKSARASIRILGSDSDFSSHYHNSPEGSNM